MLISNLSTDLRTSEISRSYQEYLSEVKKKIAETDHSKLIFLAESTNEMKRTELFDLFLKVIPESNRQHYNCNTCRSFFHRFGWLVSINEDGSLDPIVWPDSLPTGNIFKAVNAKIINTVSSGKVSVPFIHNTRVLGIDQTPDHPDFHHFSGVLPIEMIVDNTPDEILNSDVVGDFIKNSYSMSLESVEKANNLLKNPAIRMREKYQVIGEGYVEWLRIMYNTKNSVRKNNLAFKFLSESKTMIHARQSMFGLLVDLIDKGYDDENIIERFNEKTDPTVYARKTAVASVGNLEVANQIIQEMGLESALYRRIAYVDEVKALWRKSEVEETKEADPKLGVFDMINPNKKEKKETEWVKRGTTSILNLLDIRDHIKKIYINPVYPTMIGGITCPQHEDAGYLIRHYPYGNEDNQFSTYFYTNARIMFMHWNLGHVNGDPFKSFFEVNTLCWNPRHWDVELPKRTGFDQYDSTFGLFFLIDGCWDIHENVPGIIFANTIRSDIRSKVDRAVTQLTEKLPLGGMDKGYNPDRQAAFGLSYNGNETIKIPLRLIMDSGEHLEVIIDRFK